MFTPTVGAHIVCNLFDHIHTYPPPHSHWECWHQQQLVQDPRDHTCILHYRCVTIHSCPAQHVLEQVSSRSEGLSVIKEHETPNSETCL